jgi:hypothetical protein
VTCSHRSFKSAKEFVTRRLLQIDESAAAQVDNEKWLLSLKLHYTYRDEVVKTKFIELVIAHRSDTSTLRTSSSPFHRRSAFATQAAFATAIEQAPAEFQVIYSDKLQETFKRDDLLKLKPPASDSDADRLSAYIDDNVIRFMSKLFVLLHGLSNRVYMMDPLFFTALMEGGVKATKHFHHHKNLFAYEYVIVPINRDKHWYGAIVCMNLGGVSYVLYLDSLLNRMRPFDKDHELLLNYLQDVSYIQCTHVERTN